MTAAVRQSQQCSTRLYVVDVRVLPFLLPLFAHRLYVVDVHVLPFLFPLFADHAFREPAALLWRFLAHMRFRNSESCCAHRCVEAQQLMKIF